MDFVVIVFELCLWVYEFRFVFLVEEIYFGRGLSKKWQIILYMIFCFVWLKFKVWWCSCCWKGEVLSLVLGQFLG